MMASSTLCERKWTSSLNWALEEGSEEQLKSIITKYTNLDLTSALAVVKFIDEYKIIFSRNITALEGAVSLGHIELCQHLIEEGVTQSLLSSPNLLCIALDNYYVDIAFLLIKAGADVNQTLNGVLPMSVALALPNCPVELVQSIIEAGFPKDGIIDNQGQTTLHLAIDFNCIEIVKYLLSISSNLNARDINGYTPLHLAVQKNNLHLVVLLCEHNVILDIESNNHFTPLMLAIAAENCEMIKKLLDLGANVHYANLDKNCSLMPLHFAANICNLKALQLLLKEGADVNRIVPWTGETALHSAARAIPTDIPVNQTAATRQKTISNESTALNCIVHLLIEEGSDVKLRQITGMSPLQLAVKVGNVKVAMVLVSAGSELNDVYPDGKNLTTFHYIAKLLDEDLIKLCIEHGADSTANHNGLYPCHMALLTLMFKPVKHIASCPNGNVPCPCKEMLSMIKLFWENGFPYELTLVGDWLKPHIPLVPPYLESLVCQQNILIEGIKTQNLTNVLLSLSKGARAQFSSLKIPFPLHYIASKGNEIMLKVLINQGLNVNDVDYNGETPLHKAAQSGNANCCRVLLESGAIYNCTSAKCPETPLKIAERRNGGHETYEVLAYIHSAFSNMENLSEKLRPEVSLAMATLSCRGMDGLTLIGKALNLGLKDEAKSLVKQKMSY